MRFSINIVDNIGSNSGDITVTRKAPYTLDTLTNNGGFRNEQKVYNIEGSIPSNSRVVIATIKIAYKNSKAQYSKRFFAKAPFLKTNNNVKLVLKSTETYSITDSDTQYRPGSYNHTYTFDVTYLNTKPTSRQNAVVANLIYKDTNLPIYRHQGVDVSNKISKITFGNPTLKRAGEKRKITIVGYYGARVVLKVKDDNNNSILDSDLPFITTATDSNGIQSNCLDITIPKGGRYSFDQVFPSITSKATAVNGSMAASGGSDDVIFDDLTGVKVGDKVILGSASGSVATSLSVTALNPNGNNVNECTISPRLTAADNAAVLFKRSRTYDIDWYYYSMPSVVENYKLYQYRNPVLTLKAKGHANYTINLFDGAATGLSHSTDHEKLYDGVANTYAHKTTGYPHVKNIFNFSYSLTKTGKNYSSFTAPVFNNSIKSEDASNFNKRSDWTNSVASSNGGTIIQITNIATTQSTTVITLSGTVVVEKWGTKDVVMELDFPSLITYVP